MEPNQNHHVYSELLHTHTHRNSFATEAAPPSTPTPSTTKSNPYVLAHQSSSQSSSLCGAESIDVKVEITPPRDIDVAKLSNSYSIDSNATMNMCLNLADFKTPYSSPQNRKCSDIGPTTTADGLLNPTSNSFGGSGGSGGAAGGRGFAPSANTNSATKLYKKIEEMMDLSSPYNHYRCLSPSESNLTQCMNDNRYLTSGLVRNESRPSSTRLLRRQFSLDRDDCPAPPPPLFRQTLEIPTLQEHRASPTNMRSSSGVGGGGGGGRLLKQNSASVAVDLEKIEEIPISPTSVVSSHRNASGSFQSSQTSDDLDQAAASSQPPKSANGGGSVSGNANAGNEISLTVDALIVR